MVPEDWKVLPLSMVLDRLNKPVSVNPTTSYREIGVRSHGKGLFHKNPVKGKQLGNKRVFHIEPNCLILNIVFAWEQAVAKTTNNEKGMIASHRFPMFRPKSELCENDQLLYFLHKRSVT